MGEVDLLFLLIFSFRHGYFSLYINVCRLYYYWGGIDGYREYVCVWLCISAKMWTTLLISESWCSRSERDYIRILCRWKRNETKENRNWKKKQQKKNTKTNLHSFVQFQVFTIVPWCDIYCGGGCGGGSGILTEVLGTLF